MIPNPDPMCAEVSDLWRAMLVFTLVLPFEEGDELEWMRRTDHFPFGVTVRPGEPLEAIRANVADAMNWPLNKVGLAPAGFAEPGLTFEEAGMEP